MTQILPAQWWMVMVMVMGLAMTMAMTISIADGNSSSAGKRIQLSWMEKAGIKS